MMDKNNRDLDRRTVLKAVGVAGAATTLGSVAGATPARTPGPKDSEVLVGVSASTAELVATVEPHVPAGAEIVHENETLGYVAVSIPDGADRRAFLETVTDDPRVEYAEPNGTHRLLYTPNDPYYANQHAPQQVRADKAWDELLGDCGTKIAIVDQGVQYDHPDLDYCSSPVAEYDFAKGDSVAYPDTTGEDHGTAVAGAAAANTDNGTGIAGITNAGLIVARVFDENGSGTYSDIADAIQWATDQGADVINLSFGSATGSQAVKDAAAYALNSGALPVGAAGNDGPCNDCVLYPAKHGEVVAVSALDENNDVASFSSTGPEIELAAPGTNVFTTEVPDEYGYNTGTSYAAAVVSGVAGLAHAKWGIEGSELRRHLKATAVDEGHSPYEQGCGRVDAYNAVAVDPANSGTCELCGIRSVSEPVSDSLSGAGDTDCWTWNWEFADPCEVVIELDGPLLADYDLFVNEGRDQCPTTSDYTVATDTSDEQATLILSDPDTSTPLYVTVASESGSGDYTLTITEKAG